jgi:hypothetical protein
MGQFDNYIKPNAEGEVVAKVGPSKNEKAGRGGQRVLMVPGLEPKIALKGENPAGVDKASEARLNGKPVSMGKLELPVKAEPVTEAPTAADYGKRNAGQIIKTRGKGSKPKAWHEQDAWDKEDNLKPEYNDLDNNPLSTTTMRMRDTAPLFVSKQHQKAFSLRTKAFKEQEERHATELSGADKMSDTKYLATTARHDAERQELKAAHPVPPEGYTLPEGDREIKAVDTGSVAQPYRPQGKKGPRLSARNIINWPTTADKDEGKTMSELEKEDKNVRENRMRKAGITEVNMNEMSTGAPAAVTPESKTIKSAKLASRIAAGRGASTNVTRGNPDIIERAARLSKKLAPDLGESDVGHPSHPNFSQSTYASMATVMHHAGIEEDKNGTKDYEQLKKFAGDRSFSDSVETARQYIDNQKRFNSGKQTTYSAKPGVNEEKVNPSTDYFRTKKGEKVSLADMKHPENPLRGGGVMKGSESPFMGFHGDANSEEGIKPTAKGVIGKSPEWLHQGWHPYTEKKTGHRVFEHHDVSGATHMGDLVKHAIKKGRTFNNMTASLTKGSAIRFTAGEDAPLYKVTAAPSEVTTRGRRKGKELASKFGPARAAILAEGRAPLATPEGAGETTLNIRRNGVNTETTEAERTNIASTKADRSEGRFIDVSTTSNATKARKNLGNAVPSGKWASTGRGASTSDINKARAGGHISTAEALELKVSSGSLPKDKSKFKD